MSYESNDLGYERGYDQDEGKIAKEQPASNHFQDSIQITYHCDRLSKDACTQKGGIWGGKPGDDLAACFIPPKDKANPPSASNGAPAASPPPADHDHDFGDEPSLDDPSAGSAKPAAPTAGAKPADDAKGTKDAKDAKAAPPPPPPGKGYVYQGNYRPAQPSGWKPDPNEAIKSADYGAVQILEAKKLTKPEIQFWLHQNPPQKRDLAKLKGMSPEEVRADIVQKEVDEELAKYEKDKFSPDSALRAVAARGLITLEPGKTLPAAWPKKRGEKLDGYKVNPQADLVQAKKLHDHEQTVLAKVAPADQSAFLDAHRKRVQLVEGWIGDMKSKGWSREQAESVLKKVHPNPVLDSEGNVTEFSVEETAGYLYQAPADEKQTPSYPHNAGFKPAYDQAVEHLKKNQIDPDQFFELYPPPTGTTYQNGSYINHEAFYYDQIVKQDAAGLEQMMGVGNAVQWLEYKRAQGKDPQLAYDELKKQGVIDLKSKPPKEWPEGSLLTMPNPPLPPAGAKLADFENSHQQLLSEQRNQTVRQGKTQAQAPTYVIEENGQQVERELKPGETPPPGATVKPSKLAKATMDVTDENKTQTGLMGLLTDDPPYGLAISKKDATAILNTNVYGDPPILDAAGNIRPGTKSERLKDVRDRILEDRRKVWGSIYEYDKNGELVFESDDAGKAKKTDDSGKLIPKKTSAALEDKEGLLQEAASEAGAALLTEQREKAIAYYRDRIPSRLSQLGIDKVNNARWMYVKGFLGDDPDLAEMAKELERLEKIQPKTSEATQLKNEIMNTEPGRFPTSGPEVDNYQRLLANLDSKSQQGQSQGGGNNKDALAVEISRQQHDKWMQERRRQLELKLKTADLGIQKSLEQYRWKFKKEEMELGQFYQLQKMGIETALNMVSQMTVKQVEKLGEMMWMYGAEIFKRTDAQLQGMTQQLQAILSSLFQPRGR